MSRRTENCGFLCSCSSWSDGLAFFGRVHRYTARFPRHQGGKGWRGRRELAPRCSATRISCNARTRLDRHAVTLMIGTTHTTTHQTTNRDLESVFVKRKVNARICAHQSTDRDLEGSFNMNAWICAQSTTDRDLETKK